MGYFDLEDNFGYYGAFHSHPVNILIHSLFVWPNVFTTLVMLYFTPALFSVKVTSPEFEILEPALIFNLGLLFTVGHGIYYMMLDKRSGTLGALILAVFWVAACHLGRALGFYLAWKVVLVCQFFCFGIQFLSHGVIEKRKPALFDDFFLAYVTAPYFVLLEILQTLFKYEPYPGFHAIVQEKTRAELKKCHDAQDKKLH